MGTAIGVCCCLNAAMCGSFIGPQDFLIAALNTAEGDFAGANARQFSTSEAILSSLYPLKGQL